MEETYIIPYSILIIRLTTNTIQVFLIYCIAMNIKSLDKIMEEWTTQKTID